MPLAPLSISSELRASLNLGVHPAALDSGLGVRRHRYTLDSGGWRVGEYRRRASEGVLHQALGEALGGLREEAEALGGLLLVVTAPTWLTDQRPEEAVQFWRACAPEMADAGGTRKLAVAAGFEVLDHLMLPRHGWLEDFYDPLKTILEESRRKAAAQSALTAMLDEAQAEIDLCQRAGHSYSSAHYLLRRTD